MRCTLAWVACWSQLLYILPSIAPLLFFGVLFGSFSCAVKNFMFVVVCIFWVCCAFRMGGILGAETVTGVLSESSASRQGNSLCNYTREISDHRISYIYAIR